MAKKNQKIKNKQEELELIDEDVDEDIENQPNKKRGRLFKFIIAGIIFIIILSISVAILGFNVGNIRDKYLRPGLERIPIINNLLPPLEEEQIQEQPVDEKHLKLL